MRRSLLIIIGLYLCVFVCAQVSGIVLDERGESLVGANVYWAGTTTGVATDFEGKFTIMPLKGKRGKGSLISSVVCRMS